MFIRINVNPLDNDTGDCTVRAISHALGESWHRSYMGIVLEGFMFCDMPSQNKCWASYLRYRGYRRRMIPDEYYTVRDFCRDNPHGAYILALDGHVISVRDGNYYDTWDSGNKTVLYYWYKE